MHWFCAVPLGGLCVSDTASIIFHGVNIKHSREGLSIFMKGRRDQRKRDRGGLQKYLPGVRTDKRIVSGSISELLLVGF